MAHDQNCIFCKIVAGEIPAAKVYEDEHVFAFLDISQVTEGHTLVIPKKHEKDIYELSEQSAQHVFQAVPKIARAIKKQFQPVGINLLNNNEAPAGQSVFHYHIHILPRYSSNEGFGVVWKTNNDKYTPEKLNEIAGRIAEGIE